MSRMALAPSLTPGAFPAGIVPSSVKTGLRRGTPPTRWSRAGLTVADQQSGQVDGLERRRAHLVDGERRDAGGNAGLDGRLPRRDLAHAGGDDGAHDDLVDVSALDVCAAKHFLDDGGAQVRRREGRETTAQLAERRAGRRDQDDVLHDCTLEARDGARNDAPYT